MPRHKRLDISGAVHHVITRGLDGKDIFLDNADRNEFLHRLADSLALTGCRCYAWALMTNHLHILIRTGERPLSDLMRKVLTGYAIYFNRRYKRQGYLYQNRYKSIMCQEDVYFLELVRYIHLNPVRSGVVKGLEALDGYPWSGHAVLMGRRRRPWQAREEVLALFGKKRREAVQQYREFVSDGLAMGRRPELTGGGLKRSVGGWEGIKELRQQGTFWRGDERLLGDGDFVERFLKSTEEKLAEKEALSRQGWTIEKLVTEVCRKVSVDPEDLRRKGRANNLSMAKGLICYWGYHDLGIPGKELVELLGISRPAVSKAIQRGERIAKEQKLKLLN